MNNNEVSKIFHKENVNRNKKVKIGFKEYEIIKQPEIIELPNELLRRN